MIKILTIIFIALVSSVGFGQLSPGDLHISHAHLEGIENCTQCHAQGKKLDPALCLKCHQLLNEKINSGSGLHSRREYKNCEDCHVEHQGKDYNLIYWKNGIDNFDHAQTSYTLTGKHATIDCRKCHSAERITDIKTIRDAKKDPEKTFMGLSGQCISCHIDEHRSQLSDKCQSCHSTDAWKPVNNFDHNKSAYPLTGKHTIVDCGKCHPQLQDKPIKDDKSYAKFKGIAFGNCLNCHKDIHNNRFGSRCVTCHSTLGWNQISGKKFNHELTSYPLRGRHISVQCNSCHKPGQPLKIKYYSRCKNCHSDYHKGQFNLREQKGACEECHTVEGFSPSSFTIDMHEKTDYPIRGAHLAIPCLACHKQSNKKFTFTFNSPRCQACHTDPHLGQVDSYLLKVSQITNFAGCEHCHQESSWSQMQFDHKLTEFALEGKHLKIDCGQCHTKSTDGIVIIKGLSVECQSCHNDIHFGQFKDKGNPNVVKCEGCHTPSGWKAGKFDHNLNSRFPLDGKHISLECGQCHIQTRLNDVKFIRYRPMSTECKSCHGATKTPAIYSE